MAEPSAVLAAIVTKLSTLLGSSVTVRPHYVTSVEKDHVTLKNAFILVACSSLSLDPDCGWEPPVANADFTAFCFSKQGDGAKSVGDVAMDLAALVAAHLKREDWATTDGVVQRVDHRVRVTNLTSPATVQDGLSAWAVKFSMQVELTPAVLTGILHRLASIHTTYEMGGEDTPDITNILEFEAP